MLHQARGKIVHLLKVDFVRFCIVGGLGFLINLVLLLGLQRLAKLPVFMAQLIGSEVALFSNFVLHHNWTYRHNRVQKSIKQLIVQFHLTTWPAIIGSALMVSGFVRWLHFATTLALVVSSVIALLWNYLWSKYVVWRDISSKEIEEIAA